MKKKIPVDYRKQLPEGYHSKLLYGNYWIFDYVERNTYIWGATRYKAIKNFLLYQLKKKGVKKNECN